MKTKISIAQCNSYDILEVQESVNDCLDLLGGISSFVKPGDKVLLKPNMLMASKPDEYVTTHPVVMEAVAQSVLEVGAVPMVGDSPGGSFQNIEKFWRRTGISKVAEKLGMEIVNFEASGSYIKEVSGKKYPIAKPVLDCDVLINLPKIKTHGLTIFTCAVKNMYGVVPGFTKADYHRKSPKPSEFAERVVDIYSFRKPTLNIVDGIVGMEGSGPSGGEPRPLNLILAGSDGVALDSYICHMLRMPSQKIPTTRIASERGLGETNLEKMDILGWNPPIINDFKWPPNISYTLELLPSALARGLMKFWWSRPAINTETCKNCNICVKSCPVEAMKEGVLVPEFNYNKCINCLCCMEVCPHKAFYQDKSLLYKITSSFSNSDNI